MPRTDLLEQSAKRVELDQRSREARLRLEHVERLLVERPMPRQSLLRRALRYLGSRIYFGEKVEGRSSKATLTGGRARRERNMPGETGGASGGFAAAPPLTWPTCPARTRIAPVRPRSAGR
jgi:hypothetical protein